MQSAGLELMPLLQQGSPVLPGQAPDPPLLTNLRCRHSSQELEARRRQLEETGDTLSSGKPAAVLRAAVAALRGELVQMDVRTGMLQHLLLQRSCESQ